MEMPINVMIVLFISIAVGIGIIGFAEYILEEGRNDIQRFDEEEETTLEERLIPVSSLDTDSAKSFGSQCARDTPDAVTKELCFALQAESVSLGGISGENISVNGQEYEFVDQTSGNPNIVLLYINQYDELIFES